MTIIRLDGIKIEVQPADLDGDGIVGGVEKVTQNTGITSITQPTELGESIRHLNDDSIDPTTRMSKIDLNSILHPYEVSSILALDTLVALKILPTSCLAFTRQKKRLAVSQNGIGREQIKEMVAGKIERDSQAGFGDKVKAMFGGGQNGN